MKTLQDNPQFRAFATSIDYGIIVGDASGNIVDFNDAALKMFGYTEEELRNQPITKIMPARFRQRHVDGMNRYNKTHQSRVLGKTMRLFGLNKSGKEFPIEMHLSQWHNTEGKQYFTASMRQYSSLENNLGWILASSAIATLTLIGVLAYLALNF